MGMLVVILTLAAVSGIRPRAQPVPTAAELQHQINESIANKDGTLQFCVDCVRFLFCFMYACSVFHTQPTLHAHAEADYLRSSDVWVVRVARVQLPSCSLPGTTSSRTSLWLWQELNTGRYW